MLPRSCIIKRHFFYFCLLNMLFPGSNILFFLILVAITILNFRKRKSLFNYLGVIVGVFLVAAFLSVKDHVSSSNEDAAFRIYGIIIVGIINIIIGLVRILKD